MTRIVTLLLPALLGLGVLLPDNLSAQKTTGREGFTGRQLFEHEWKWTGPVAQPSNPADVRAVALSRAGLRSTSNFPKASKGDGLGPLHNATSCAQCHVNGGASGVDHNVTLITIDPRSEVMSNLTSGGKDLIELFPGVLGAGGRLIFNTVVHDRSTRSGYHEIRQGLTEFVPGGLSADWFLPESRHSTAIAAQPVVAGRNGTVDFYLSQRNSPSLFGLGVVESISTTRLKELARRQARSTNGKVTGRFAGKFGWRGQVQTLFEFVSGACAGELGLNLGSGVAAGIQADDPADPRYINVHADMKSSEFTKLVRYVTELPRPVERIDPSLRLGDVIDGEEIFNKVGCVTCHIADIHPVSGMFSDLLLHDMGAELQAPSPAPIADLTGVTRLPVPQFKTRVFRRPSSSGAGYYAQPSPEIPAPYPISKPEEPQFPRGLLPDSVHMKASEYLLTWDTLQREWRTPPLWGVADTAPYLHDGRAETLEEAILWHGGEAKDSRDHFAKLTRADRDLVIAFLSTLRSPENTEN